jgi:translation initiation factor IF-2|tara:strand:- start:126 stop:455 length:330 start_codon:yes stop_codon:yes gene_type:complete
MAHTDVNDIEVRRQNERQTAVIYKFMFKYKGKQHEVQVVAHSDVTTSEIEDRAGEAAKNWMESIDEKEHKRPPTAEERIQIGKAMNEFLLQARKRGESSNNRLYYPGVN